MKRDDVAGRYMGLGHLDGQETQERTETSGDPNQGLVAKYLDDRPIAKFLTTTAATVAGGVIAGSLVRRGGRRAVQKAVRNYGNGTRFDQSVKAFRGIQAQLDELEGVHRRRSLRPIRTKDGKVEWRDDPTRDEITTIHGFHQKESRIATGDKPGQEPASRWRLRDEMQKELVKQGRRLPYELPGAYVAQKTIFDSMLGNEDPDRKVNWHDPLDVAGDFIEESAKNIAFGFAPFASGQAAVRQGWRRTMSYGDQAVTGYTGDVSDFSVGINSTLRMVGQETTDLIQRTINVSRRSGGALSSALRESAGRTRPVTEQLERMKTPSTGVARHQRVAHGATPPPTGPLGQVRTFAQKLRDEWRVRGQTDAKFSPSGITKFERAAHATGRLRGQEDDILRGDFGEKIAESDYTKRLKNHLVSAGVEEEAAEGFLRHGRVRAPIRYGQDTHPSRRVRIGERAILDEGDDFWDTVQQRTDAIVGPGSGRQIRDNLEGAIRRADQEFTQNRDILANQVQRQFDDVFEGALLPGVEDMLGTRRLPFNRVQDPTTPNAGDYLLRQTARRLGVGDRTSTGVRRSGQELRAQIADRGIDPEDSFSMRSFLIEQGDISPPWSPEGRNIFGLRSLSVNDAMRRGVFRDAEEAPEMQRLGRGIERADDTGFALDRAKVGGLYEDATGEILDIGSIKHGARSAMDRIAQEFQIPLLKLRPLQISGYGGRRRMATGSAIRYSGPEDNQLALGDDVDDSLGSLWFQKSGARGNVTALSMGEEGVSPQRLAGTFLPNPTDATSALGRFARRMSGQEGSVRVGAESSAWRERMDVPARQDSSLLNLGKRQRFTNRDLDVRDPNQMAQLIESQGEAGLRAADPTSAAMGIRGLAAQFRDSGFGRNVLRNADPNRAISRNMRYGDQNLLDMDSPGLRRTAQQLLDEDLSDLPSDARRQADRARRDLLNRWRNAGVEEIDQPTPQAMSSTGMHRRSDELRMDIARYLATRSSLRHPNRAFVEELEDMGRELDEMFNVGAITRQDLAESRSAVASFQLASQSVTQHSARRSTQQAAFDLADGLIQGPHVLRQAISDFARYQGRYSGAFGRNVVGPARAKFGIRSADDAIVDYNPLSEGQDMLFTPTMGTAFGRSPLRAAGHGLGVTDYKPDQAPYASTLGSWTSHMFTRMNDVLRMAHMGVREGGRYAGSMDMFARGMIGKRVLPAVAGGATAMTVDRHLGQAVHQEEDQFGDPVYKPLVLGAVGELAKEASVAASAITPGGMTGEEKRQQLEQGDVPIRRGRFWPFSDCLSADSLVQLPDGEYKRADEVSEGDLLYTHDGNWQPVLRVMRRPMREGEWTPNVELHNVTAESFKITTTDEHPYLVVKQKKCPSSGVADCRPDRNQKICRNKTYKKCYEQQDWDLEWIYARDIEPGDYVAYPRPKLAEEYDYINSVVANRDTGYIAGFYLADGNIHSVKNDRWYGAEFSLNKDEVAIRARLERLIYTYFGAEATYQWRPGGGMKARFCEVGFGEWLKAFYGYKDKMLPSDLFSYNSEFLLGLLEGLIDGDGSAGFSGSGTRISIGTSRLHFAVQIRNLLLAFGIENSVTEYEAEQDLSYLYSRSGPKTYRTWDVTCQADAAKRLANILDCEKIGPEWHDLPTNGYTPAYIYITEDYVYIKVKDVIDSGYRGEVFDYEVQESHSFSSLALTIHNSPFKGGDVKYYRPSWYRRLNQAPEYTEQQYGSPAERLMFGYDFSPGRIFDPYRQERENYYDRPYPVTGEYFTGPWGPLRGALNATVGRMLKPPQMMHEDVLAASAGRVEQVGSGVGVTEGQPLGTLAAGGGQPGGAGGAAQVAQAESDAQTPAYPSGSTAASQDVYNISAAIAADADRPLQRGSSGRMSPGEFVHSNQHSIIGPGQKVGVAGSPRENLRDVANQAQEWAGIYGFAFGAVRENLGLGSSGYTTEEITLSNPNQAFGQHAQFWNMELGGLGDVPTPMEGRFGSLEVSELMRRFIGGERRQNEFNPIPNTLGRQHPWLPGYGGGPNLKTGDPYSMNSGLMRMPGQIYERFNQLHPDESGRYGTLDRLRILGDVSPQSREYSQLENQVIGNIRSMSPQAQEHAMESMRRAEKIRQRHEFTEAEYRHSSPGEKDMNPAAFYARRAWEEFKHLDTPAHSKLLPDQTATEAWESDNVYDVPFSPWEQPIESFVKPTMQKSTQRNPITGAGYLGLIGSMFGGSREAKLVGGMVGGAIGAIGGMFGSGYESVTGDRWLPEDYKRQVAVQEHVDILEYTRARRSRNISLQHGNQGYASYFQNQMESTMYGIDPYNATVEEMAEAVPDHKSEHFEMMAHAPVQAREQVLSTAGRLERRLYQGLWGREVESRPDLGEYFQDRELPPEDWSGWSPRTDSDIIQIKMLQDQGLNASRMGYYPQQIREANTSDVSRPELTGRSDVRIEDILRQEQITRREVQALMRGSGVDGQVRTRQNASGRRTANVSHGG